MIIRGTTPTIQFTYNDITVSDITVAILSMKQKKQTVIEKDLTEATVGQKSLSWTLTQEETLSLTPGQDVTIVCDWKLASGVRGRSKTFTTPAGEPGKDEVI